MWADTQPGCEGGSLSTGGNAEQLRSGPHEQPAGGPYPPARRIAVLFAARLARPGTSRAVFLALSVTMSGCARLGGRYA